MRRGARSSSASSSFFQVAGVQEVAVDQLERGAGLARRAHLGRVRGAVRGVEEAQETLEPLAAADRLEPATAVVGEDDVELGEEDVLEEGLERAVFQAAVLLFVGDQVGDVPVEDELADGTPLEDLDHLARPAGQRAGHVGDLQGARRIVWGNHG
jgi:hypothetical protein